MSESTRSTPIAPWHENRRQERIESVRRVLRVKHQRGLNTVSVERYEEAVALVNELVKQLDSLHDAMRRIAYDSPPEGAGTWHSGRSWRIELARRVLRGEA